MKRVRMDTYPVGTVLVNELMAAVMTEANSNPVSNGVGHRCSG